VAGVDVGYIKSKNISLAVVVLFAYPSLQILHTASAALKTPFPYIPGLLTFREGPVILKAMDDLTCIPDLIFFDGHGITHPRSMGIATHIGILLGMPSIGIAKKPLWGQQKGVLSREKGATAPIVYGDKVIGIALRTRSGIKPVYVSQGNMVSLETAVSLVNSTVGKFRIPIVTRIPHIQASKMKEGY
jgi:deoxyribonuclease V